MGQFLIDNNALSNFFSGQFSEIGMNFMAEVLDQSPLISVVTEIEALSWICPDKSCNLSNVTFHIPYLNYIFNIKFIMNFLDL
ncbi:MAG TPA: hypothetical protein PK622_13365 [Saprospiraceae bacterium]|nr:hypothetical protein [Saprospiraceae bacterium]